MGQRFKWHMFFTSFLPLWVSIVVCDIWVLVEDSYITMISLAEVPSSTQQMLKLIRGFLLEHGIEVSSVVILAVYSVICMCHINKTIRDQESSINKPKGMIKQARRSNKLSAEFLLAYILP